MALCWSIFIVYFWKATPLQQVRLFSTGLKDKNKLMNFFCLLNFIFHQLLITHNSITITLIYQFHALQSSLHFHFEKDNAAMRFFKNASKKKNKIT